MRAANNMLCNLCLWFQSIINSFFTINRSNIFLLKNDFLHALFFVYSSTVSSEECKVYVYECAIFKTKKCNISLSKSKQNTTNLTNRIIFHFNKE